MTMPDHDERAASGRTPGDDLDATPLDATSLDATPLDDTPLDDTPLDYAATAALIAEQRARVAAATDVDARLLFGAWGVAWLLGFGALFLVSGDDPLLDWPRPVAGVFFAGVLVAAMVVTAVHLVRRTSGVHGASATQGAMYGWTWSAGFVAIFALGSALSRAGASQEIVGMTMSLAPTILTGVLYMAGAAIWQDRTQFALGVWILGVTVVASVVGWPYLLAVMSLAGGGGMLLGALVDATRRRRAAALTAGAAQAL